MTGRSLRLDDRLHRYVIASGLNEHPELRRLRQRTAELADGDMQSSPEQMQLVSLLLRLTGARRVLEIGCFTGYGSLAMALALSTDGKVVTLDVNGDWAAIGREHWRAAGVEERIELRLGLALSSLEAMDAREPFDFAYVDADKKSYGDYFEHALRLVRDGGIIVLDNMLWKGAVADPDSDSRQVTSIRSVQQRIHDDSGLTSCLVPVGDGIVIVWKKTDTPYSG